jgi:RNA polymerase sigma-70 factor (ECF subfamily)
MTTPSKENGMKTEIERSNEKDDPELIRACQRGDQKAFTALFNRHRGIIEGLAFRMLRDRESAKDVIQEAMLRIIKSIQGFEGGSGVSTWIYKITFNECLRHLNQRSGRREVFQPLEVLEHRPSPGTDPLAGAIRDQEKTLFEEALKQLEPQQRSIMTLFYHAQMGLEDIAESMNLPLGTVNSRLARAKIRIRELINVQDA